MQYVMYFSFVDDVMFSYNVENRPESMTTRIFPPVRQAAASVGRQTMLFGRDRQVAAPRAKSAVSDSVLFLTVNCFLAGKTSVKVLATLV